MRPRASAAAVPVALGLTLLAAGCSNRSPTDGPVDTSGWLHGIHAFDMTSTIDNRAAPTVNVPGQSSNFGTPIPVPSTQAFTLVLDADHGIAIFKTWLLRAKTDDGHTFVLDGSVTLSDEVGYTSVDYGELRVTVEGETIGGSAAASVTSYGGFEQPSPRINLGLALLTGHPDATPPAFSNPTTIDPDYPLLLYAPEPLPASSVVSLRDPAGNTIVFSPYLISDSSGLTGPAAAAFERPKDLVLDYGTTYTLVTDEIFDFAGHQAPPLAITTIPLPPLVPPDGFESSPPIPGATIIGDGPLPVINGSKSLYVAAQKASDRCPVGILNVTAVRLAMPAGAKTLRFSARTIQTTSNGRLSAGGATNVGRVTGRGWAVTTAEALTEIDLPDGTPGYLSPVTSVSAPLPAGANGDVIFTVSCANAWDRPGLILDDLRVE